MKRKPLFFDLEFTGLVQNTSVISIAIISQDGAAFYAEINDFNTDQVTPWLRENVLKNRLWNRDMQRLFQSPDDRIIQAKASRTQVTELLRQWLSTFGDVEIWGDCCAYDWVLFCEFFGGALNLPANVSYISFDICTLFKAKGIDPDISRMEFARMTDQFKQHNAQDDAIAIMACYERLCSPDFF